MKIQRRTFLTGLATTCCVSPSLSPKAIAHQNVLARDRLAGMLWGTLIGDAMGGPLEFADENSRSGRVAGCRDWDDDARLDAQNIATFTSSAGLIDYTEVRPETAPYGPWVSQALAGTLTDDSRLKIVLIRAIKKATQRASGPLKREDIAESIIEFTPMEGRPADPLTATLLQEGMAEYRYAAQWVLGKRNPKVALPLDRLWAGVANCSGQMMMLPLAGGFAGKQELAYRRCFELNFVDAPAANDIASAIIAGLASVLGADADSLTESQRWQRLESTIRTTDPYRFADVPFVGRPLHKWLDLADSIVQRADGRPKVAYQLLETIGQPVYYWDAHFTLLVAMVLLKLTDYNPLASLHLAIDFGHDTDSYAQLIGAMAGAACGSEVFVEKHRTPVSNRLLADYGESIVAWMEILDEGSWR